MVHHADTADSRPVTETDGRQPSPPGDTVETVLSDLADTVFGTVDGSANVYAIDYDDLCALAGKVRAVLRRPYDPDQASRHAVLTELADRVFGADLGSEPDVYADDDIDNLKIIVEAAVKGEPLPPQAAP